MLPLPSALCSDEIGLSIRTLCVHWIQRFSSWVSVSLHDLRSSLHIAGCCLCGEEEHEREKADGRRRLGLENRKYDLTDTCMRRYIGERREKDREERKWALAQ